MFFKMLKNNRGELDANGKEIIVNKEEPKPYSAENIPKNKEQWTELQGQDPVLFSTLTQQNVDRLFRENKELSEKNTTLETQTNNLTVELESYKTKPVYEPPVLDDKGKRPYDTKNYPKTKAEWDDLAIDDPTLHADLRWEYNRKATNENEGFERAQDNARKVVQVEHPDMYLSEIDENGQPKKDAEGKVILKASAQGDPIFNPKSEKGKLWETIYNEDPNIAKNKNGPTLLMAEMERRLRAKGAKIVKENEEVPPENQVITDGVPPPKKLVGKFVSEEEKAHVTAAIKRGVYTSEQDFFDQKNKGKEGIFEENSFPDFKKQ